MATIAFTDDESDIFVVRKAIFRMMLSRAGSKLTDPADIEEVRMAEFAEGISFDLFEGEQRVRIGHAIFDAAKQLRDDVASGNPVEEAVRPDIKEFLDELVAFLSLHVGQ